MSLEASPQTNHRTVFIRQDLTKFMIATFAAAILVTAAFAHFVIKSENNDRARHLAEDVVVGLEQVQALANASDLSRPLTNISTAFFAAKQQRHGNETLFADARSACATNLLDHTWKIAGEALFYIGIDPQRSTKMVKDELAGEHDFLAARIKECELYGEL